MILKSNHWKVKNKPTRSKNPSITDSSCPIEDARLRKIFKLFSKGNKIESKKVSGNDYIGTLTPPRYTGTFLNSCPSIIKCLWNPLNFVILVEILSWHLFLLWILRPVGTFWRYFALMWKCRYQWPLFSQHVIYIFDMFVYYCQELTYKHKPSAITSKYLEWYYHLQVKLEVDWCLHSGFGRQTRPIEIIYSSQCL